MNGYGKILLAAVLIAGLWGFLKFSLREDPIKPAEIIGGSPSSKNAAPIDPSIQVLEDAPFALEYGREGTGPERELELVQLAFQDYLQFVKEDYRRPIGDNQDFVAVLTGGNPYQIAPIHPGHSRINQEGELTDSQSVPLVIHALSETAIEVRSAGLDGVVWTKDDLISVTLSGGDILGKSLRRQNPKR